MEPPFVVGSHLLLEMVEEVTPKSEQRATNLASGELEGIPP
jgi:hypothetical protein